MASLACWCGWRLNPGGLELDEVLAPACLHHWQLDSPHGTRTVVGVCDYCRAERQFPVAAPRHSAWVFMVHESGYAEELEGAGDDSRR